MAQAMLKEQLRATAHRWLDTLHADGRKMIVAIVNDTVVVVGRVGQDEDAAEDLEQMVADYFEWEDMDREDPEEPVDWDEQDRRAFEEEKIARHLNER